MEGLSSLSSVLGILRDIEVFCTGFILFPWNSLCQRWDCEPDAGPRSSDSGVRTLTPTLFLFRSSETSQQEAPGFSRPSWLHIAVLSLHPSPWELSAPPILLRYILKHWDTAVCRLTSEKPLVLFCAETWFGYKWNMGNFS